MLLRLTLVGFFLAFNMNLSAKTKISFSELELQTEFKITHPIITAKLLDETLEQLIVLGEDEETNRVVAIYRLENDQTTGQSTGFTKLATIQIPKSFLAYDLLKTATGHKLVFQSNKALHTLNPVSEKFEILTKISSIYLRHQAQFLVNRDFAKDINGDELDDIAISDFKGVHLLLQAPSGEFIKQTLPISPKMDLDGDSATYSETPLYFADLNLDKKTDLVVVAQASLNVFSQNGHGGFETLPHNLQLPIDVNPLDWWEVRESDGESMDQSDLSHRTINQIEDINNDSLPDLLVRFSQSEGVLDRQNNYEVYLGQTNVGGLTYSEKPNSILAAEGTTVGISTLDLNGDKRQEMLLASLDIGVSQIIGALLSGSIDQDVSVYKMDKDDNYGDEPLVDKEVELSFSLSSGQSGQPVVEVADFNGDGLKDLMFSDGEKTLRIYPGTTKKRLFERRSKKHKVLLPKDGNFVETKDLNNDGKFDVIIRYGRQDDAELSNRIVIMIAS